jgi:hypothetical protein
VTYAPGHRLVSMNSDVLCSADSGLDGAKVLVKCNATSNDMYNIAAKNANVKGRTANQITKMTISPIVRPHTPKLKYGNSRLNC